jgi:hypothetical protein
LKSIEVPHSVPFIDDSVFLDTPVANKKEIFTIGTPVADPEEEDKLALLLEQFEAVDLHKY